MSGGSGSRRGATPAARAARPRGPLRRPPSRPPRPPGAPRGAAELRRRTPPAVRMNPGPAVDRSRAVRKTAETLVGLDPGRIRDLGPGPDGARLRRPEAGLLHTIPGATNRPTHRRGALPGSTDVRRPSLSPDRAWDRPGGSNHLTARPGSTSDHHATDEALAPAQGLVAARTFSGRRHRRRRRRLRRHLRRRRLRHRRRRRHRRRHHRQRRQPHLRHRPSLRIPARPGPVLGTPALRLTPGTARRLLPSAPPAAPAAEEVRTPSVVAVAVLRPWLGLCTDTSSPPAPFSLLLRVLCTSGGTKSVLPPTVSAARRKQEQNISGRPCRGG